MRVLIVSRYKTLYFNNILPFVYEQGEALRGQGVDVEYLLIKGNGLNAYFSSVKPLVEKIKDFEPDLIHAHYGLSGVTAVAQNKIPVVTTFHNGETLSVIVNLICSLAALRAKHVVCVAKHIYDKILMKPKNYSIIPCGVDLEKMPLRDHYETRKKLNFEPTKKYILFGGAFDNLRKNYPLLREAVTLINDYEIEVVEMKGLNREQLNDLMFACDVFCLPSKSEGSPQALKEAMACNCPIVATDVADIKHLLGDVEGHYLCDFSPQSLAVKLKEAFAYGKRTAGRNRIEKLGLDNKAVASKLVDIYKSIV